MTIHLNTSQGRAWGRLAQVAAGAVESDQLREAIGVPLLDLLGSDTYASMVWNRSARRFRRTVSVDMDVQRLKQWQDYYRLVDPLTMRFMQRREPTVATQLMARRDLLSCEFFSDFLRPQNMHWGINVFFYDEGECLGDLRIWRSLRKGDFGDHDLEMLRLVEPVILAALVRLHRTERRETATDFVTASTELTSTLSPRQIEVAQLLRLGATDKEISRALGISYATVRFHVGHVMRKLQAVNRTAVASSLAVNDR
jgi:DNA-binding CsgD family transcriptional regulator